MGLALTYLAMALAPTASGMNPIIVQGNKLYDSGTGERFFLHGITYAYAMDDDTYDKHGKKVIENYISSLKYNVIRLYNLNPDLSYEKFMTKMEEKGVYVVVSAVPGDDTYFEDWKYATLNAGEGPDGDFGGCYPAKLLEFGKSIVKNFAKYPNTLSVMAGNEIFIQGFEAASCVKTYVSDLKSWMKERQTKLRYLPVSYTAADNVSPNAPSDLTSAEDVDKYKLQGLLCGDSMTNGRTEDSIDIFMINTYRWCATEKSGLTTAKDAYKRINDAMKGSPIPVVFGEFGCHVGVPERDWSMVPYLFDEMKDVFSGGFAYSYGVVKQDGDGFAIFKGGDRTDIQGEPSNKATPDYQNLVDKYDDLKVPQETASWDTDKQCQYSPPNSDFTESDWFGTCSTTFRKVDTREGAICNDNGTSCDVFTPDVIDTPEEKLCSGNTAFKLDEDKDIDDTSSDKADKDSKTKSDEKARSYIVWIFVAVFGGIIVLMLLLLCLRNTFDKTTREKHFTELPAMNLPPLPEERAE